MLYMFIFNPYHAVTFHSNIYQNTMLDSSDHNSMIEYTSEGENSVYPNQLASNKPSDLYLHCFKG